MKNNSLFFLLLLVSGHVLGVGAHSQKERPLREKAKRSEILSSRAPAAELTSKTISECDSLFLSDGTMKLITLVRITENAIEYCECGVTCESPLSVKKSEVLRLRTQSGMEIAVTSSEEQQTDTFQRTESGIEPLSLLAFMTALFAGILMFVIFPIIALLAPAALIMGIIGLKRQLYYRGKWANKWMAIAAICIIGAMALFFIVLFIAVLLFFL
jgi:hypothetical protein